MNECTDGWTERGGVDGEYVGMPACWATSVRVCTTQPWPNVLLLNELSLRQRSYTQLAGVAVMRLAC
eukprot:366164-Chlamydomonas_euryale.AAC.3